MHQTELEEKKSKWSPFFRHLHGY